MIGILGGMGTQAGLDLCNKLSMLYREKSDQNIQNLFFTTNQKFLKDLKI